MFTVKTIKTTDFKELYEQNFQMQFVGDKKLKEFLAYISNLGVDYENKLVQFQDQYSTISPSNETQVLNNIGKMIGLPSIEYFGIDKTLYTTLIKGQQVKFSWDGTNEGIIKVLNTYFPQYEWAVDDTGTMAIDIYMIRKDIDIDENIQNLFQSGWLTPKPAGVSVDYKVITQARLTWDSNKLDESWDNGVWL